MRIYHLPSIVLAFTAFFFSSGLLLGAAPGQKPGHWKLVGEVPKPLDQPGSEAHEAAAELMAQAWGEQNVGNNWSALSLYGDIVKTYPNTIYAPEAHYQRGQIYTKRNQFQLAVKEYSTIIRRYPAYPKFNQVIAAQYKIGELIQAGERPYYWGAIPGFRNYKMGIVVYEDVVESAPYSEYAPLALMNIAILANKAGKEEEAIDALDRLINHYPASLITAEAYLALAQTYSSIVDGPAYDQEATQKALGYYQDFMMLYPNSDTIPIAEAGIQQMREILAQSKFLLGDFYYYYRDNARAALIFYNEAITIDPNTSVAAEARTMIQKIQGGVKAPMTLVDWFFGRYHRPSDREYLEQSQVDNLEDEAFQMESTEAFLATPGVMAEETFTPGEQPQEYTGVGVPLDPFLEDPEGLDPFSDEPFETGLLQPYEAPGPNTSEQKIIDQQQQENAQNPNLPAGAQ